MSRCCKFKKILMMHGDWSCAQIKKTGLTSRNWSDSSISLDEWQIKESRGSSQSLLPLPKWFRKIKGDSAHRVVPSMNEKVSLFLFFLCFIFKFNQFTCSFIAFVFFGAKTNKKNWMSCPLHGLGRVFFTFFDDFHRGLN